MSQCWPCKLLGLHGFVVDRGWLVRKQAILFAHSLFDAGAGDLYQLGMGNTYDYASPALINDGGSSTYRAVSCGGFHTCALRSDGQAVCFGDNRSRQCGDGTFNDYVQTPTAVTGGIAFKRIATGGSHTCGLRASDGRAMCFGVCYGLATS